MSEVFKRKIENFTCGHCGAKVVGNGYTNHCTKCLWSRHVDKHPGDRAEECGGLMRPEQVELIQGEYVITHKCERCGAIRRVKAAKDDEIAAFLTGMI